MATVVSLSSISPNLNMNSKNFTSQPTYSRKLSRVRCNVENSSTKGEPEPRNALLKIAWYGSELLGIAASFLRSPSPSDVENDLKLATDGSGAAELDRATVVEAIKEDFARSYFVTGNITLDAYEEDCEFADPAGSFKGLRRFKRNCTNFGLLIDKSNMNLTRWDDFENGPDDFVCDQLNMIEQAERIFFYIDAGLMELLALNCIWAQDKGIGHWRFNCIMSFPWRPILSATGYTEYYFNAETGRVCRHVEHWNVPKMALFKQILRPSRVGRRKSGG
ncbi:hypothetical protein KPL70_010104 [Citrus sinensis]|uniref:Uncharacterized protein n=1 Tax=Citrus sinensis TaxID=2711 RepID=A0ACB8MPK3_CITSI|nr:hypothetical protein KPL70_010104 [Citrus sinensis]KAH9787726.1 hypothetical protein KPL71_010680 [Citrus sinensis]